jgi:membrane protease YdiL (CAAX protease family)
MKIKAPVQPKVFGPVMSLLFTVSVSLASPIWALILIKPILQLLQLKDVGTSSSANGNPWINFTYFLIFESIILYTLLTLLKVEFSSSFKALGLNKIRLKYIAYAIMCFVVYFGIYIISIIFLKQVLPGLNLDQKQELGFDTTVQGTALIPVFLSLVILAPVAEEITMRGFLYTGLRTKLPMIGSAIIVSIVFAAAHLLGGSNSGLLWAAAIDTFILSMALCYLREKTGSLWPGIGVHMIKNSLAFVVLFKIIHK